MRKVVYSAMIGLLAITAVPVKASVNVSDQPMSLLTSPMVAPANSDPITLFSFTLAQTEGESLSSVGVQVNSSVTTTISSDLASVKIYKDDGSGTLEFASDTMVGSNTVVNIGSETTVDTGTTTIADAGSKFFVTLSTSPTWGSSSPVDSLMVSLPANGIVTSTNSPTTNVATTAEIKSAEISTPPPSNDDDDDEGEEPKADGHKGTCPDGIKNGQLYRIGDSPTVYLAAACRLKPFRGAAVFKARGLKFQNITVLATAPSSTLVSDSPVLPAGGTLVKGSNKTVWFVTSDGKKRGFVSGKHFLDLGFLFSQVLDISDTDLALIPSSDPVEDTENHPDGTLILCYGSGTVFEKEGSKRFAFANIDAFKARGHSFEHIIRIDCVRYSYTQGSNITD